MDDWNAHTQRPTATPKPPERPNRPLTQPAPSWMTNERPYQFGVLPERSMVGPGRRRAARGPQSRGAGRRAVPSGSSWSGSRPDGGTALRSHQRRRAAARIRVRSGAGRRARTQPARARRRCARTSRPTRSGVRAPRSSPTSGASATHVPATCCAACSPTTTSAATRCSPPPGSSSRRRRRAPDPPRAGLGATRARKRSPGSTRLRASGRRAQRARPRPREHTPAKPRTARPSAPPHRCRR
jgi:hypothetical protein